MTFKNGSRLFYSIDNVSFDDLCTIIRNRNSERVKNDAVRGAPTIYFDVSYLARKLSWNNNHDPSKDIISLAIQFAKENINVVLAADNRSYRHHSKKATIERNQQAEQARIDTIFLKKKLLLLVEQSRTTNESENMKTVMKKVQQKIRSKEKFIEDRLKVMNLYYRLRDDLMLLNGDDRNDNITLVEAVTQADHVICFGSIKGDCDAALANDGDFIMLAGKKMLMITKFFLYVVEN